ncbi:MAG TPA: tripartite tricarboxylate transporter permease, partial [Negativicutes bacterium]|nr:tripartite tricarboxylate transporter permease [Negativicutes bacterium]
DRIVLTFVLGRIMEDALLQSLIIYRGNFFGLFTRPIAGSLLWLAIIIFALSLWAGIKHKKDSLASDVEM